MKTTFIDLQSFLKENDDFKANNFINYVQIKYFDNKSNFMNISDAFGFLDIQDKEELEQIVEKLNNN